MNDASLKMDAIYRFQRHVYDLTRKPYLLGRDTVIRELAVPSSGTVLEIGCGTARNLLGIARRYPTARCFGIDVSSEMLQTARMSIKREQAAHRVRVELGDATSFDPKALFGEECFDRIIISYALSMILDWKPVLDSAANLLAPKGALYVVDFSDQAELPGWFRQGLFAWLNCFSVTPRLDLSEYLNRVARSLDQTCRIRKLYKGYAILAELHLR